ncbi:MAG: response regulator [Gammaproteobacteria bacterium]|nr:response regulator [Gammaproteobacteria bacterium]
MAQLLVVDDDNEIRSLVSDYLSQHGYTVFTARDGETMLRVLLSEDVDLVLLDLMLPGEDGLALCRWLRDQRDLSIIMVTALASEGDRVTELEMGADDYLTKPFSTLELLDRVRAVLRRAPDQLPVHRFGRDEAWSFAGWTLRVNTRELVDPKGTLVSLTGGSFDLLLALVRHPGRVLNRDQLLELTRGRRAEPFDHSIDVQLSRLRKQLGGTGIIKIVRGGGYLLALPVAPAGAEGGKP